MAEDIESRLPLRTRGRGGGSRITHTHMRWYSVRVHATHASKKSFITVLDIQTSIKDVSLAVMYKSLETITSRWVRRKNRRGPLRELAMSRIVLDFVVLICGDVKNRADRKTFFDELVRNDISGSIRISGLKVAENASAGHLFRIDRVPAYSDSHVGADKLIPWRISGSITSERASERGRSNGRPRSTSLYIYTLRKTAGAASRGAILSATFRLRTVGACSTSAQQRAIPRLSR